MMKTSLIILCVVNLTIGGQEYGAPQTIPMPYEYGYGVNDQTTGDVKEHYETRLENGRTVGEYRLLQENGLFRVVRYFVDGNSGFQAAVTEEKGEEVTNYAFNSRNGDSNAPIREKPIVRSDVMLSDIKLDAAASISQSHKFKIDSSEDKNSDYEFLENRQSFDPQKHSTISDVGHDEIYDVRGRTYSNEDSFERSNRGANHQPLTDSKEYDNDENLASEEYFEKEVNELSPPKVNFESAFILKSDFPSPCEPFSQSSQQQGCIGNAPKSSTLINPVKATKPFINKITVNTVNTGTADQQPQYSSEASESTKHLIAVSQPKESIQSGRTHFVHELSKPRELEHDNKILTDNQGSDNFATAPSQLPSPIVKLDKRNNSLEKQIVPQNKNTNSFLHHHSFSPNSNKVFKTFVSSPTIRVGERPNGVISNVNSPKNVQSGSLNLIQNKIRPNTVPSVVKNHSSHAQKKKKSTNQISILNSKGEKVFLPDIPLDQIRKIIVVDGKGSAPRVLLDSNDVAQKTNGQNLKSFNPIMFFQNGQGTPSSLNQKFNEKFTGLSGKPTKAPSFESLRSQRNLETLKILADVKNDNHVRKTRQQIIENVLKDMNTNPAPSSESSESLSRERLYPTTSNLYSQ